MKDLIDFLNSYPGVNLNEDDFIFTTPVYNKDKQVDIMRVKGKLKSNAYIDQEFSYKRYNLGDKTSSDRIFIDVTTEKSTHDLLYKLNKLFLFPYQEGSPGDVKDKYMKLRKDDIEDYVFPPLEDLETTTVVLKAKPTSYYFRGSMTIFVVKKNYVSEMVDIVITPLLIEK